jgi:hypothetical protein
MPYNYNPGAKKIILLNLDSTTTILAGQSEVVSVTPATGKIYSINALASDCPAPPAATTGEHRLIVGQYGLGYVPTIKSAYNISIQIAGNAPNLYSSIGPNSIEAIANFIKGALASNSIPFVLQYVNATDVDQTNTRRIRLVVEEFDELP